MQRTRLDGSECPVARSLDMIGEWWSLLIIRDALRGLRRFEEFQESLGIARNMLSRRLKALVAAGILEKRAYATRPPRYDYRLTEQGEELLPVIVNLHLWGNRWAVESPAGPALLLVDRASGRPIEPVLSRAGAPITNSDIRLAAGPGAGPETRATFARLRQAAKRSGAT
ncbi:MAG: helix-turn-helix transcriptional regulator [Alphaproteobacteria bacterium]|nr:helix-turn-helix transcriptional regulator [Alphaproteobacteria bacterium]